MKNPIILTDADNTLWDTNQIFANAQVGLLAVVENAAAKECPEGDRLAFVRRYDQALAAIHHAHLKYPPMLLVRTLALGLNGYDAMTAASSVVRGQSQDSVLTQDTIEIIVGKYVSMLREIPHLLPTVSEGLALIRDAGITTYVITEGAVEKQKNVLLHHSIGEFVTGVFEVTKNQTQFERLRQRFASEELVVIGDQPDRDIVPARNAGCTTVLVPGRFRPHWHDATKWNQATFVASTFAEGVEWILQRADQ